MQIKVHPLPEKSAMIGGLAADSDGRALWVGLAGTPRMVWRFDTATGEFACEPVDGLLRDYSYVHRSVVSAPDGRLFVGATWIAGIDPTRDRPRPFSSGNFIAALALVRWFGRMLASCRILCRQTDGSWSKVADRRHMSVDLAWDADSGRLLRWSPLGVTTVEEGSESTVLKPLKGFVHQLAVGPGGEHLLADEEGGLYLQQPRSLRIRLGSLEDEIGRSRAAPGIDGLIAAGPHHFVGGTRNCARPFVVDLRVPSLRLLAALPTGPRWSGRCKPPKPGTGAAAAWVSSLAVNASGCCWPVRWRCRPRCC